MVLTHGAGGGVDSADLLAARDAAARARRRGGQGRCSPTGCAARGRRDRPPRQDAAWLEIIAGLRAEHRGVPLVQGGRSNGARVACRTARAAGAQGVLALAFPLHPPGKPEQSRLMSCGRRDQRAGHQRDRDPFGVPDSADGAKVVVLAGETHALSGGAAR